MSQLPEPEPKTTTTTELVFLRKDTSLRISQALLAVNAKRHAAGAKPLARAQFIGMLLLPAVLKDVEAQLAREARADRLVLLPHEAAQASPRG